ELVFQNEEKEKRAKELIIANKKLAVQNKEKGKRAKELIIANKELAFQNEERKQAEKKLQKSRDLLNETGRLANVGGWEINLETQELNWTDEVYHIHEVSLDYIPTVDNAIKFYAPESIPIIQEAVQRAIDYGEPFDLELQLITAKGNLIWVHAIGKAHLIDRKPIMVSGTFQDITERKQTEEALRTSEEKYRHFIETTHELIQSVRLDGHFDFVNKAWLNILGYKKKELSKLSLFDIIHPEFLEHCQNVFKKVLDGENITNVETKFVTKDSSVIFVEGNITGHYIDGELVATLGFFRDITERNEAEGKIRENEEKFRSLVDNSPDIIMRIDPEGVIDFINYEYSNQKPEDLIGQAIYKFIPSEFHEVARSTIKKVFETGKSASFENLGIGNVDKVIWYRNNIAAISKDGKIVAATVIARDISEQKQAEIMQYEFIASISHELRTPLTTIRESLSLLSDGLFGELNSDQIDLVNPCLEDVDRLGRIINNLLDISRIEGKRIKLERKMEDIVKLVQSAVSSFGHQAASKNIELVFSPSSKSINLYLDSNRIIQVFMNLIGNAIKFTEKGKIEVLITERKDKVECCIADTGRGIEQKDLGTLFDRLHQVGKLMRTGEKGSGLGLSICKGIVKQHKGKIWVNSAINKGSKFYFSLPKYSTDEIIIENIENEIKKLSGKHIKRSLLLVRLNNYSDVESKLGADKADEVTKSILKIIQETLAPGEFSLIKEKNKVVLFSDITEQNINILISKLKDMLTRSVLKINKDLTIDLSYGCSIYPDNGENVSELIQHASKELLK
ncbi:PAS domain S-box protein, partial [bacterium]|nr:PAS domain S-box protein [bacterium]